MKKVVLIIGLIMSLNGYAANDYVGTVAGIKAEAGIVLIYLKGGTGATDCGAGNSFWIDPTKEFDQSILSMAMMAKASATKVWVLGHTECKSQWPYKNARKVAVFHLRDQ